MMVTVDRDSCQSARRSLMCTATDWRVPPSFERDMTCTSWIHPVREFVDMAC